MPHLFVIFGGLMLSVFLMIACVEDPKKPTPAKVQIADCTMIPEIKKDRVADLVVQCVNNATAKNTGENQDADDWVEACSEQISNIYRVRGYRKYIYENGSTDYLTGCQEFRYDSTLTKQ